MKKLLRMLQMLACTSATQVSNTTINVTTAVTVAVQMCTVKCLAPQQVILMYC